MPRKTRAPLSYRWVYAWLTLSAVLALALLGNAVRDYLFVSRLLAIQQVRRQMRQTVNSAEQQFRKDMTPPEARLKLLRDDFERAGEHPVWIELRNPGGKVLDQSGIKPSAIFTSDEETETLRSHEPLYRAVKAAHSEIIAEVFQLHLPPTGAPAQPNQPAPAFVGPRALLLVEVALPLTPGDPALLKAQRWNLFIGLSVAFALLATVVFAAFSIRRYVRGRLLEQQLEIAREVQARLLPASIVFPCIRIATEYQPSEQVGGDLYDLFQSAEGKVAMVIGDVSGKGLPAALLMGVIHGAIRSSRWTESPVLHRAECASLNRLLCDSASGERYATLFWCYVDPAADTLNYVNAGHCPPQLLTHRNGTLELIALDQGGPVVGILRDASYTEAAITLMAGDVLVMFSDGIVEAVNARGEEFGSDRLRALLVTLSGQDAEEIRTQILDSLHNFRGATPLGDDLTLVVAVFE